MKLLLGIALACGLILASCGGQDLVVVGSKKFTESVVLGEVASGVLRASGVPVRHEKQLGGTRILWSGLLAGDLDLYVEYTGTLREEIFAGENLTDVAALRERLRVAGVSMSLPLGFNNTYALGMREALAAKLGIECISDLTAHPELRFGLGNEFLDRGDGWRSLAARYGLEMFSPIGLDHDLAYLGIAAGEIDVMDLYSTDAEIAQYDLRSLVDDRSHFPSYDAVILWRSDLGQRDPAAIPALRTLEGRVDEATMIAMNAAAKLERVPENRVAADFLKEHLALHVYVEQTSVLRRFVARTLEHLFLVVISLCAAILVALPLGVLAARRARVGRVVLGVVGVLQTIPSYALLALMVPVFGLGAEPAIVALFLYSLLPIVRGAHAGLTGIPGGMMESAVALGLSSAARLRLVELPMATRSILSGIQTSAVINVGTATLGALVGARGYGQPIMTGIRLNDPGLILEGALPAALLALVVQGIFELVERALLPRGLRLVSQALD